MAYPAEKQTMSVVDYLALEEESEVRHEFINGVAYAMAGGTIEHATIGTNLTVALATRLRGSGCRAVGQNQRLNVQATGSFFYPDVLVICGPYEIAREDRNGVANPRVIIEVLSDSTRDYDGGTKFQHYKRLPSLREYVLVDQNEERVEVRTRAEGGWFLSEVTEGALKLTSLEIEVPLAEIYDLEGVRPGA